ncbi:hypothetical protein PIB30_004335 [Stylosanthes scabra]|uniref:TIR domain-containing protein n=1 Tax=Stylosanthes scabra TaxID=79078 RepID=A0ABU6T3Z7_9FABA|nr:hypothetical protein [Stylosanthes scabra]
MDLQSPFSSTHSFNFDHAWKYDVFISFRGQDTRYGFTGNLCNALCRKGIHTFIDDEELQRGDEITPSLLSAIQESRIAIIVLSPNYASSSFCLDELVHILHCIKGKNRLVLPVFFEVDPCDVRHQRNSFGEAMAKHEKRFKDDLNKVQKWKEALHQVANLSGYHFKHGDGYEHMFIGNIVENISKRIKRHGALPVADHLVGLESPVSAVALLLDVESNTGVHMVGIYGIGGIGRTTLALVVYNLIADNFEGVCFLENVRENSNKHGLVHLQSILLCKILGKEGIQIAGVREGASQIRHRLHQKKVLLVLDDVDECEQLTAIAEKPGWFGPGSRIIITTRDKHLLTFHGVERTYEVQGLNKEESLDLLIWKAFKRDIDDPRYTNVLTRAVTYASGLPLALEVIGSNLFGKGIEEWESALDQYEKILDNKIRYTLMEAANILQAHYGRCMKYHIGVLVEKSLVKIEGTDRVTIHDLTEDMGKEIVLEKSTEIPGNRSRLWFYEDIAKVLEDNQGTSTIEMIYLEFPLLERKVIKWDGKAFKEMTNLKTLIIKNGWFSSAPKYLRNSLRVLEWWEYPSKDFPYDFQPKELSILKLPHSLCMSPMLDSLTKASELASLNVLNFDYNDSLREIPDVSSLQSLQELSFKECSNLIKVHNSVGFLPKLKTLNAYGCCKLRSFPTTMTLPLLEDLRLSFCSSLEYFPEIPEEMENLDGLELHCTDIKDLPCSFRNLSRLAYLDIIGDKMCEMPSVIGMMPQLIRCEIVLGGNEGRVSAKQEKGLHGILTHSLPSSDMEYLQLTDSNLSDEFFPLAVEWFPEVEVLYLTNNNFTVLPECIQQFRFQWFLNVDGCEHLREIRGIPPCLIHFSAVDCKSLSSRGTNVLLNQGVHENGPYQVYYTRWKDFKVV